MTRAGVVAALRRELAPFGDRHDVRGDPLAPVAAGIGAERAKQAAERLRASGATSLVSFGFAGGLDSSCASGDLLLPVRVVRTSGEEWHCDTAWRERLGARLDHSVRVHGGVQLASDIVLRDRAAKSSARATGALAVDQESGAIGGVAARHGLPFLVVRAVCDVAAFDLPHAALAAVGPDGELRVGALGLALLRRPWEITALARLGAASRHALRTLADVVRRAGHDLAFGQEASS